MERTQPQQVLEKRENVSVQAVASTIVRTTGTYPLIPQAQEAAV
jgi:hypothetical protein